MTYALDEMARQAAQSVALAPVVSLTRSLAGTKQLTIDAKLLSRAT